MFHALYQFATGLHSLATALFLAVDERTRRAGVWLVHGVGWPWSIAVVARDVAAGQPHPASFAGPILLGLAALIQASVKADQWFVERAERRRARKGRP